MNPGISLPSRPERHLWRRPVAPPPLQRPVTLGELIRQLEDIAERLEHEEQRSRSRHRPKRYSERAAIAQVAALAHREKLPETTAALSRFLLVWEQASDWADFDALCAAWAEQVERQRQHDDLDCDRAGVFWALLFLTHQGKVELQQQGGLYGPLHLKRLLEQGESRQLPLTDVSIGSAQAPSHETLAA
jgi:segregation and condensation protein A